MTISIKLIFEISLLFLFLFIKQRSLANFLTLMNSINQAQVLKQAELTTTFPSLNSSIEILFRAYQTSPLSETHDLQTRAIITDDYLILSKFFNQMS